MTWSGRLLHWAVWEQAKCTEAPFCPHIVEGSVRPKTTTNIFMGQLQLIPPFSGLAVFVQRTEAGYPPPPPERLFLFGLRFWAWPKRFSSSERIIAAIFQNMLRFWHRAVLLRWNVTQLQSRHSSCCLVCPTVHKLSTSRSRLTQDNNTNRSN